MTTSSSVDPHDHSGLPSGPRSHRVLRIASQSTHPLRVLRTLLRQRIVEWRVRRRTGGIRSTDVGQVARSYGEMSREEFEAINGGQEWVNAHTIPWALQDLEKVGPWQMVDLGCGTGGSSALLASLAPADSRLIGYDLDEELLRYARQRRYHARGERRVRVEFVRQSISSRLHDAAGEPLPAEAVDVVHSAGVVGHHLDQHAVDRLAGEVRRVLAPDGIAILDAGPINPPKRLKRRMQDQGFELVARYRVLPFGTRAAMLFRKWS